MSANAAYEEILTKISRIYDKYEERSREAKEKSSKRSGSTIDKMQNKLVEDLELKLEPELVKLIGDMDRKMKDVKATKGKNSNYVGYVRNCHNSVKNILKKRPLNFRVNKQIVELVNDTNEAIVMVRNKLPILGETTFMCCGTDGKKQFEAVMNIFRIHAAKWEMIETLESKGSVETFLSPEFNTGEYAFIKETLARNWPKQSKPEIQTKTEYVQKVVEVYKQPSSAPSPLNNANQYLFGINREENPHYGLRIYHEEADKKGDANACAYLGKIYEEGVLLPKDLKKAVLYYKKAMQAKHSYASYRFAMCLIRGELNKEGQNKTDIDEAYKILMKIATGADACPEAIAQLGYLHEHGTFYDDKEGLSQFDRDLSKAIKYYEKARAMHLPKGSNNLGLLYYENMDMNPASPNEKGNSSSNNPEEFKIENMKRALQYFYEAQKFGYPQSYYNLGMISKEEKEPQKALHYFYEGASKGDYLCKIKFAYELMNQTSILKEEYEDHYHLAVHWLEGVVHKLTLGEGAMPSESGLQKMRLEKGQALYYLGLIYEHGFGVEKSPKKAFTYFLKAADVDYPAAKNKIGDCYFSGYGVQLDRQLAIGCYIEAAELQNSDSMVNLGTVYLNGIPNMVERNYNKAHEYFCKAMELENSDAMIHLSYMYRNGLGLDNDDELAKKLLEEAAKKKNATALYMLKEIGEEFNKGIYYENLENEFFSPPKRIDIRETIPQISGLN